MRKDQKKILVHYAMKEHENYELIENESVPWYSQALSFLNEMSSLNCMRSSWFTTAVNVFVNSACADEVVFVDQCMHGPVELSDLSKIVQTEFQMIVIPIILTSMMHHMTAILVDKIRKRIIFYNAHGSSPLCEIRPILNIKPGSLGVVHVLSMFSKWTGFEVMYSPLKEQSICSPFQCGAFTKAFIERAILFPNLLNVLPISLQVCI